MPCSRSRARLELGSYDLYVPPKKDARVEIGVQEAMREAIIGARFKTRGLDRTEVTSSRRWRACVP